MADGIKSGQHPEKALSAAFVRSVAAPGKYTDGNGLFLKVDASGAKRWVQRIVIRGKRTELGLGSASLVSLAEARETALANRKLARQGGDPLRARREAEAVLTFEEASREVHRLRAPTWRNKKHAAQFLSTLETYAFPRIGGLKVSDVSTADVLAVLQPIWLEKDETARRVRQRIGTVMKWAIAKGWRQDDPAQNIGLALPKHHRAPTNRKSLPYSEVAGFIEALQGSNAAEATKLALEFLILTAARPVEVRGATWSEIDLDAKEWRIPASRMKANKDHRVPLSERALAILHLGKELADGSGLVFPGSRYGRPISENTLPKLVKSLGYNVHVHGFRTSFRTWAQERTNVPREVAETAIAHTEKNKTVAAYARSDFFDKRRRLMDSWSKFVTETRKNNLVKLGGPEPRGITL